MAGSDTEKEIGRRNFVTVVVGLLGSVIGFIIALPGIGYLIAPGLKKVSSDAWIPLGSVEDLDVDVPHLFSFTRTQQVGWERTANSYGVYVIPHEDGTYTTFSNICTHLSCRVSWKDDLDEFVCPCHDGHFAEDGTVLSGPPPRPLDTFEHRIEEGILQIHLLEG